MNRSLTTIAVLIGLFIGQSHTNASAEGEAKDILYLHCFHPTFGQQIVADPDAPTDMTPATPPSRLATLKVNVGIPFEFIDSRAHGLSGQIMADGDFHRATLEGGFGSGFRFSGRVELEKVFDTEIENVEHSKHKTIKHGKNITKEVSEKTPAGNAFQINKIIRG